MGEKPRTPFLASEICQLPSLRIGYVGSESPALASCLPQKLLSISKTCAARVCREAISLFSHARMKGVWVTSALFPYVCA